MVYKLRTVDSTSTYLKRELPDSPHGTVVTAYEQTAGRGQRGNHWESEPGKNLTFSILLRPEHIDVRSQYTISEAVAVSITEMLKGYVPDSNRLSIKWPNDIYYGDKKICGILIENTLTGNRIDRAIAGIGININQAAFLSDAPNPVSLKQLSGQEYDTDQLLSEVITLILSNMTLSESRPAEMHARYRSILWRRDGYHPYMTPGGEVFEARIVDIAPTGHLTLARRDETQSTYAFKEVIAII